MNRTQNQRPARRMRKAGKNNKGGQGYALVPTSTYTVMSQSRYGFLDPHMYVTLRYSDAFTFTNATLVGSQQIMNLNSIFDPDRTGSGHQPYGFDQLAALYNRYRVLSVSWRILFAPTSNQAAVAVIVPVNGLLNTAVSSASTFNTACEIPFARTYAIPNAGSVVTAVSGIKLNELNGCTLVEYLGDDRFESAVTSSPSEVMTLYIAVYNPTTVTVSSEVSVQLTYEVDFHDPISLGGS